VSKCYKIKNLFGSYIYNTISQEEKSDVDEHIKTCKKCAEDLRTQQETIEIFKVKQNIDYDDLLLDEESFVSNVYRRIAIESIKQKSRQVKLRKFVYQPALATAFAIIIIAFVFTRIDNIKYPENKYIPIVSNTVTELPEIDDREEVKQDAVLLKNTIKSDSNKATEKVLVKIPIVVKKQGEVKQSRAKILLTEAKITNSRDWLLNADLINYSLGEPLRALSKYQMIIDHYPDTEAAKEAQKRIKTILDSEFTNQREEFTLETELNDGI
jgi:DNA-binding XRE family transcriptional regulator